MRTALWMMLGLCGWAWAQQAGTVGHRNQRVAATGPWVVNMAQPVHNDPQDVFLHLAPRPGMAQPASLQKLRKQQLQERKKPSAALPAGKTGLLPPGVGSNFQGNPFPGSLPNDNHLAISNGGHIVSVINTTVFVYDSLGNQLSAKTLAQFGAGAGTLVRTFDPRVVYDPTNDRFVVVFLEGSLDSTSLVIVAFSQTNDPTGNWNVYALDGNPLNNSTWSDFPSIGLGSHDLFIAVNTFFNGSTNDVGFYSSCFWMVDLASGYAGQPLITEYLADLTIGTDTLFNVCPVEGALGGYGPDFYLLSNELKDTLSDTMMVLKVQGRASDSAAPVLTYTLRSLDRPYGLPPEVDQPGVGQRLDTNDGRVQAALLHNDTLHLVLNSLDTASSRACVYYARLSANGTDVGKALQLMDEFNEFAYGDIAYLGDSAGKPVYVVGALVSSGITNPGIGAFKVREGVASEPNIIKTGLGILALMFTNPERWGDYTGIQKRYNQPGRAWMSGSFAGGNFNENQSWIAEVLLDFLSPAPTPLAAPASSGLKLYPNPVQERINLEFDLPATGYYRLDILTTDGQVVRPVLRDRLKAGTNRYSFAAESLPAGAYVLRVTDADAFRLSKPFVVR